MFRPELLKNKFRRRPTLPHDPSCSTIGAGRLNYRVRYGTGCFPSAKATGKTMGPVRLGATPRVGAGSRTVDAIIKILIGRESVCL